MWKVTSLFLFAIVIGLSTSTLSLAKGGLEDLNIQRQFTFYLSSSIWMGLIVICLIFAEFLIIKGDNEFGDGLGFYSLGELPHLKFFENFSGLQLTWLFSIVFLILGLLNILLIPHLPFLQNTYTGVGVLQTQQFSETDSLLFSTLLVPAAETIWAIAVIALVIGTVRFFARRFNIGEFNFVILCMFLVPLIMFIFGITWHNQVYPESDVSRITGGMFWAIGGLLTVLIGIVSIFWSLHVVNNLIYDLSRFFSSDNIVIAFGMIILLMIIAYVSVYKEKSLIGKYG